MRNEETWLLCHPSMEPVAVQVAERCETSWQKQQTTSGQRRLLYKKVIQWGKFNDGFPNLFIDDVKGMAGKDVILLISFHTPEVVFEQLAVVYAIPRYMARSLTLILPYFPTGTMERVDTEGQIATAKTLTTLLSSIPQTSRGPPQVVVFDIHALQERFYFSQTVIPRLESAIPLLIEELKRLPKDEKIAIAFPDDGAFKRFQIMFENMPRITCCKLRDGDARIVKIKEGDPTDCHVVIVDDLVQSGGTLIESAKALMAAGARCISAYVTHAVFPRLTWKRFLDCEVKFENFWITDSVPHAREICENDPFRLLTIADSIAAMLIRYDLQQ